MAVNFTHLWPEYLEKQLHSLAIMEKLRVPPGGQIRNNHIKLSAT